MGVPFTYRELAGPWSWVANRYYWFVFDEVMKPAYQQLVRVGGDPVTDIMQPADSQLAGNVELALERTQLAFRVVSASRGSVVFKVGGVWKALKCLASWLPIYGAWLQNKGRIDIRAEVERSAALRELTENFASVDIPLKIARRMALKRLYSSWPDFYAEASRGVEASMSFEPPKKGRARLMLNEEQLRAITPTLPSILPPEHVALETTKPFKDSVKKLPPKRGKSRQK